MTHSKTIAEIGRNTKYQVIGPNSNFVLLFIVVLSVLKLTHVINISWWIVTAPFWFSIAIVFGIWFISMCLYLIIAFLLAICELISSLFKKKHF